MGLMMFLVPLGLGSLVLEHPLLLRTLHWGGAAFLLWLSWRIATSSSRIESMPERNPVGYLGGLFVLAALPSCFLWLAFGAAVQRVVRSRRRLRIFNIVMGALLALSI